jgi:carbon storage regulator
MLVLSRKPGEVLKIGDDVEITIVEVKGEMVRLGIEAPRAVQVWRKELWDAIVAENKKAAEEAALAAIAAPPAIPAVQTPAKLSGLLARKKKKEE